MFEWLGGLVSFAPGTAVVDVACGPGWLWEAIAPSLPDGLSLTLADLSEGMVREAVPRVRSTSAFVSVEGVQCDAQALPFPDEAFDVVVCTYALYHVPDPRLAVRELARITTPDGVLVTTSNGPRHLRQIEELRAAVLGDGARWETASPPAEVASMMVDHFDDVTWARFDDELHCLEPDDVVAFALSYPPGDQATPEQAAAMGSIVAAEISRTGMFVVEKDTGAVIGRRPRR